MKRVIKTTIVSLVTILALSACGQRVEIGAGQVGKVMGKDGYRDMVHHTSKFRLDPCLRYCDNLVILDVTDNAHVIPMRVFMPQDRLELDFQVSLTLAVNPEEYPTLFSRMRVDTQGSRVGTISIDQAFKTYAEQIINTSSRSYMANYTIMEIAANRETIGEGLALRLTKELEEKTPFVVRHAALSDVQFPSIVTDAQIRSAERREQIAQEEAELLVSEVRLNRELQEERLKRLIEVERAEAEAQVSLILSTSLTPEYVQYRQLQFLDLAAGSDNKVFIPVEMLNTVATQVQLGRE